MFGDMNGFCIFFCVGMAGFGRAYGMINVWINCGGGLMRGGFVWEDLCVDHLLGFVGNVVFGVGI